MLDIFNTKHWRDDEAYCPAGSLGLPAPNAIRCSRSPIGQSRRPGFTDICSVASIPIAPSTPNLPSGRQATLLPKSAIANSGSGVNQACFNENRITTPRPQPDYCKETLAKAQLGLTKDQPKWALTLGASWSMPPTSSVFGFSRALALHWRS